MGSLWWDGGCATSLVYSGVADGSDCGGSQPIARMFQLENVLYIPLVCPTDGEFLARTISYKVFKLSWSLILFYWPHFLLIEFVEIC